jgi:hypothetical protein
MNINDSGLTRAQGDKPIESEVKLCEKWIREFVTPRKAINTKHSSYGLKHAVERWTGEYVSNGAFIQAAVNLGYEYRKIGPDAYFNMTFLHPRSKRFEEAFHSPKKGIHTKRSDERIRRMREQAQEVGEQWLAEQGGAVELRRPEHKSDISGNRR